MDSLKRTNGAPLSRRQFVIASATFGLGLAAIALPPAQATNYETV